MTPGFARRVGRRKRSQQGFTLVESLVSATILMIAILGMSAQYISQVQATAGANLQLDARLLMNSVKSEILAKPAKFVRLKATGAFAVPLSYVACYGAGLTQNRNNCNDQTGYMAVIVPTGLPRQAAPKPADCTLVNALTRLCNSTIAGAVERFTGGFEVQITPMSATQIDVDVVVSDQTGRSFSPSVRVLHQSITVVN